ncbi:MAG: hypothetical protein P1P64_04680 [Treponemataceae bacterium]
MKKLIYVLTLAGMLIGCNKKANAPANEPETEVENQKKMMSEIIASGAFRQLSKEALESFKKLYAKLFKAPFPENVIK